ncbi:MAG: hypothetical protein AB1422_18545 [bacterium]
MKKTIISVMLLIGLIISPTSAFTAQIYSADAILTPAAGNLMGGLGCFVGGEFPGQYDWTIGNCVPGGTPTDDMVFSTNDGGWQERMRITKDGNVGIGTREPETKLDVKGEAVFGNNPYTRLRIREGHVPQNDNLALDFVKVTNFNEVAGRIEFDGYQYQPFHQSQIRFFTRKSGESLQERMVINESGNVGIGTTGPNYKLDVEGDVQAHAYHTGDIFFQKDGEELWRMFEDKEGLYLESLKTGKVYRFLLQEVKK